MKRVLYIVVVSVLCACTGEKNPPRGVSELLRGTNVVTFDSEATGKKIKIHYHIPEEGDMRTMHILFAMHGADRAAEYQIDTWRGIADERGIMVFAPLFTREDFPANHAYQFGGISVMDNKYDPLDPDRRTVAVIEAMFDYISELTGTTRTEYDLWGHSAGSQFTHRSMFFLPRSRVRIAVASNAGSYMMPSLEGYKGGTWNFPHSLRMTDGDYSQEDIEAWFARPMIVHLGTADTATTSQQDSSLPTGPAEKAQGASRLERGRYFFDFAQAAAEAAGVPFNWQKVEVANVPHSSRRMVQTSVTGAADLMYPDSQ